jgi:hypothetical protein
MDNVVIKIGHVESVYDDADGLRIKARLKQDGDTDINDLPYAFPLLPKTIQSVPKENEAVFVLTNGGGDNITNRVYIGPIISQPQHHEEDRCDYGRGTALSLLDGGSVKPLEKISNYESTHGAFPNVNDIALVGRVSEDVILKEGEIDLRCGIRTEAIGHDELKGKVVFNDDNPSYVQMRYKKGLMTQDKTQGDSVVNIVADKVNIMSHKDDNINNKLTDREKLIKDSDIDPIMEELHQLPYGDVLVKVLRKIVDAISNHYHLYPGLKPHDENVYMKEMINTDLNTILSDNVRIS